MGSLYVQNHVNMKQYIKNSFPGAKDQIIFELERTVEIIEAQRKKNELARA